MARSRTNPNDTMSRDRPGNLTFFSASSTCSCVGIRLLLYGPRHPEARRRRRILARAAPATPKRNGRPLPGRKVVTKQRLHSEREDAVERFLTRFGPLVSGVLSGFDRIVFHGILQPLMREFGMYYMLKDAGVQLLDFKRFALATSERSPTGGSPV